MADYGNTSAKPEKGSILISEPFLQDLYFQRSVILLAENNEEGAMGVVLNKRTQFNLNEFFSELKAFPPIPIYLGGPVSPDRLFFIHSFGNLIPEATSINKKLYFGGDLSALLEHIAGGSGHEGKAKFFMGYSGWSKGQLKKEIDEHSWVVASHASGNDDILCTENDDDYWKTFVMRLGRKYHAWINFPKHPHLN